MRKEGYAIRSIKYEGITDHFLLILLIPCVTFFSFFYFKISLKISSCSACWSGYTTSVQTVRWHVICDGTSREVKL